MLSTEEQELLKDLRSKPRRTLGDEIALKYFIEKEKGSQFRTLEPGSADFEALAHAIRLMETERKKREALNQGQ